VEPDFDVVLDAARAGEEWAVTVVYRDLHPRLARYLRARARHVAEDLEADVWLAIATRLHQFQGDEVALRAWAFSIARRRLVDHQRQSARRRTDVVPTDELDRASTRFDPERIVLDELAGDEAAAFVIRTLPADQAEVVLLRVVAGLDVEQVAALVGRRPGTVRVMQHRGLKRLERVLAGLRVTK
jgi:RNA polymerase sigma-70 factor (ECF subfamily)